MESGADRKTYVYLAGLTEVGRKFDKAMIQAAGSEEAWQKQRAELIEQGRYSELLYD